MRGDPAALGVEDFDVHRCGVLGPGHVDRDGLIEIGLGRADHQVADRRRDDFPDLVDLVEGDVAAWLGDDELVFLVVLDHAEGEDIQGGFAVPLDVLPDLDLAAHAEKHPDEFIADGDRFFGELGRSQLLQEGQIKIGHADLIEAVFDVTGIALGNGFHHFGRGDVPFGLGECIHADAAELVGLGRRGQRGEDEQRRGEHDQLFGFHPILLIRGRDFHHV